MQKMFRTSALVVAGVASLVVLYEFGRYLPQVFSGDRRCAAEGMKFGTDYEHQLEAAAPNPDRRWDSPQTHYNHRMGACLVEVSWDEMVSDSLVRFAILLNSDKNQRIIRTRFTEQMGDDQMPEEGAGEIDPDQYSKQRDKLFSE